MFYETAGTIGPITAVKLIDSVGENESFFLSPVSLALAGLVWFFIRPVENQDALTTSEDSTVKEEIPYTPAKGPGYLERYRNSAYFNPRRRLFRSRLSRHVAFWGQSIWNGAAIVLGHRRFIWLVPCYSFALLAHR